MSKEKISIIKFESLSPEQQKRVLEEFPKTGHRPATSEEVERMKLGNLVYKEGRWQLEKPLERLGDKESKKKEK